MEGTLYQLQCREGKIYSEEQLLGLFVTMLDAAQYNSTVLSGLFFHVTKLHTIPYKDLECRSGL